MVKRAPDSITIRLSDGRSLDATNETPGPAETGTLELIEVLQPRHFDKCPICGDPEAISAEYVPPERVGGTVMTRTCTRCNNEFGSKVEADLVDWYEGALTTWFTSSAVRGKRRIGRLLVRWTENASTCSYRTDGRTISSARSWPQATSTWSSTRQTSGSRAEAIGGGFCGSGGLTRRDHERPC